MRRAFFAVALGLLLLPAAPCAAQNPASAPQTPPRASAWSGLYLGPTLGWTRGSAAGDYTGDPPPPAPPLAKIYYPFNLHPDGIGVGGVVGYNLQFGSWIVGIEGDISWIASAHDRTWDPGGTMRYDDVALLWTAHTRARFGFLFDQYLVYVAGGAAFAETTASHYGPLTGGGGLIWSDTNWRSGYSVGGGVEMLLSNWVFRIEYLYDYFANQRHDWVASRYSNSDLALNTLRASVIFHLP